MIYDRCFFFRPVEVQVLDVQHQYVQISVDMLTNSEATNAEMQAVFEGAIASLAIGDYAIARSQSFE